MHVRYKFICDCEMVLSANTHFLPLFKEKRYLGSTLPKKISNMDTTSNHVM